MHLPASQKWLAFTQSALVVHEVLHAVAPHTKSPHGAGASLQLPAPSQVLACVSTPSLQALALHVMAVVGKLHFLVSVPSQVAAHSAVPPTHAGRVPCGLPVTGVHVPSLPTTSHAAQPSV